MVSKEDTSMLNALRAAAKAGFTAAEQALPADVAYEAVAPVAEELAFTPTAWSYDAPIAGEAEIADMQRIAADVAADVQAQLENPSLTDGDIKTRLITAKSLLSKSNITASDLRAAIEVARDAVAAAQEERGRTAVSNSEETSEQKINRLNAEIAALNKKIAEDMAYFTDPEQLEAWKKRQAAIDAMPDGEAKDKAQQELWDEQRKQIDAKVESTPEGSVEHEKAKSAQHDDDERRKIAKQAEDLRNQKKAEDRAAGADNPVDTEGLSTVTSINDLNKKPAKESTILAEGEGKASVSTGMPAEDEKMQNKSTIVLASDDEKPLAVPMNKPKGPPIVSL